MTKILFALGLVTALAAPAMAGRLDADLSNSAPTPAVDTVVTNSIDNAAPVGTDRLAENAKLFGANSR